MVTAATHRLTLRGEITEPWKAAAWVQAADLLSACTNTAAFHPPPIQAETPGVPSQEGERLLRLPHVHVRDISLPPGLPWPQVASLARHTRLRAPPAPGASRAAPRSRGSPPARKVHGQLQKEVIWGNSKGRKKRGGGTERERSGLFKPRDSLTVPRACPHLGFNPRVPIDIVLLLVQHGAATACSAFSSVGRQREGGRWLSGVPWGTPRPLGALLPLGEPQDLWGSAPRVPPREPCCCPTHTGEHFYRGLPGACITIARLYNRAIATCYN